MRTPPHAGAAAADVDVLRQLLSQHSGLATARLGDDDPYGMSARCCTW